MPDLSSSLVLQCSSTSTLLAMRSSLSGDFSWSTKETAEMTGVLAVLGGESERHLDPILFFGRIARCGRRGIETLSSERVDGSVVKVTLYSY